MSSITVKKSDGQSVNFRNTIGHQIGNGAVQIMKGNGEQAIFNNFIEIQINLTDEEKKKFKKSIKAAEARAEASIAAQEVAHEEGDGVKLKSIPLNS